MLNIQEVLLQLLQLLSFSSQNGFLFVLISHSSSFNLNNLNESQYEEGYTIDLHEYNIHGNRNLSWSLVRAQVYKESLHCEKKSGDIRFREIFPNTKNKNSSSFDSFAYSNTDFSVDSRWLTKNNAEIDNSKAEWNN